MIEMAFKNKISVPRYQHLENLNRRDGKLRATATQDFPDKDV